MSSVDLISELNCSICLEMFSDPVMLKCGHSFCRVCIACVLDTQERQGVCFCPECREEFQPRPGLQRNINLRKIVDCLRSSSAQSETTISPAVCIQSPGLAAAAESCLPREADKHLSVQCKLPENITSSTLSMKSNKCEEKLLYFDKDQACDCPCMLNKEHRRYCMDPLTRALERKGIGNALQEFSEGNEELIKDLQDDLGRLRKNVATKTERLTTVFKDIRRHLGDLENKVQREIARQEEQAVRSFIEVIQYLEIRHDKLSRKGQQFERQCNMTKPPTHVQTSAKKSDAVALELEKDREMFQKLGFHHPDRSYIDQALIERVLHKGWTDLKKVVDLCFCTPEHANLLLDVNTAGKKLCISDDMKTASWTRKKQIRPGFPNRFQRLPQVLSTRTFSSGRHYWEVEILKEYQWGIGMCYPSMDRLGPFSRIGFNNKSWCLMRFHSNYDVSHNLCLEHLSGISIKRFRVYLDYEAGELSFYELCDPIRHLYTFTVTFTEPLHAVLYVEESCIQIQDQPQREVVSSCAMW